MSKTRKNTTPLEVNVNVSPPKKQKKLENHGCILNCMCMKTAEPIISFSKASRESVYKAAKLRNDEKVISLLDLYGEELPPAENGYHRKCYQTIRMQKL